MDSSQSDKENEELQDWERELLANHRWGRLRKWLPERDATVGDERMGDEHARLRLLWEKAQPLPQSSETIIRSIVALEICNWNLEASIMSLCKAIGSKTSPQLKIGHNNSITDERWRKVWAYYLTLRKWQPNFSRRFTGYEVLLKLVDPEGTIQQYVRKMLGESTTIKQLYVERFCLNLEYWLGGFFPKNSPQLKAYNAAVTELETEILKLDPETEMLEWMRLDGKKGWIEICHHKAFRRLDINISSIGEGKWRGAIPRRGTDGLERATTLEKYLFPIETWIKGLACSDDSPDKALFNRIHDALGERDDSKLFLASLLVSLLRSQQVAARLRGEKRQSQQNVLES
jgi:hypothetical protein